MPELAEVEFYRKQWNCGLKEKVLSVHLHAMKRIFRGTDTKSMERILAGATMLGSQAHGKQMLFQFSKNAWLGLHLGMTGKLRVEKSGFVPQAHDHLVLQQKNQALVFSDPRLFGRVLFHVGKNAPPWWIDLPGSLLAKSFTRAFVEDFLRRHRAAPIKAVLLMQSGFPGIGNWMADEILWRSGIHPKTASGKISSVSVKILHQKILFVCREAMRTIAKDFSDPPKSWLFQHRWKKKGNCPRCHAILEHDTIGGRTTCWCPQCQGKRV